MKYLMEALRRLEERYRSVDNITSSNDPDALVLRAQIGLCRDLQLELESIHREVTS